MKYHFECYEDFNGHIYLAILDNQNKCVCFQKNCEKFFEDMIADLNKLMSADIIDQFAEHAITNPQIEYDKFVKPRDGKAWIVADKDFIYWDSMEQAALNLFKRYENSIYWDYENY